MRNPLFIAIRDSSISYFALTRVALLIVVLAFSLTPQLVQAKETDRFILSGLDKVEQKHPWLEAHYPSFQEDLRKSLIGNKNFLQQLRKIQRNYSGTVELQVKSYLDDNLFKQLLVAGVGMTVAVLTGGFGGTFTTFEDSKGIKFELILGKNKHQFNVPRNGEKLVEMPENGVKVAAIRNNVYKHMKDFFIEDAILAMQLMGTPKS